MRWLFPIFLALYPGFAFPQDDEREVPLPYVSLIQPPVVAKLPVVPLTKERVEEIEGLIAKLTTITERDLYLNRSIYGSKFVPVGEFENFGIWRGKQVEASDPIRKLIEIGPDALPYLLDSLENHSATNVVIDALDRAGGIDGWMAFDEILPGNPANPVEQATLRLNRFGYSASIGSKDGFVANPEMQSYRIRIGDVCLVIIGQIVGRHYECLTRPHVKSSGVLVCSPVSRKAFRTRIRTIWKSNHPRQKLLESLLLDFSTRGLKQQESLDYWDIGNDIQIEAIKRLLYYYPEMAVPLIVDRLKNLRTSDNDYSNDCFHNGLRSEYLVDAVAWSKSDAIRSALSELARDAKGDDLLQALDRAGVKTITRKEEKKD